jgi:hypothetical protein
MKAHFGVDSRTKLIHAAVAMPANVADSTVLPELLHGNETRVWGDQAYRGQRVVIRQHAPKARDFTNRRYRHRGVVDEVERAKNAAREPRVGFDLSVFSTYQKTQGIPPFSPKLLEGFCPRFLFHNDRGSCKSRRETPASSACASRPASRRLPGDIGYADAAVGVVAMRALVIRVIITTLLSFVVLLLLANSAY